MTYVDLNPIMTDSPESSGYTSMKSRINALRNNQANPLGLYVVAEYPRDNMPEGIPFRLVDFWS